MTATTFNLTIPNGQTFVQFSVPIILDLIPEPQEFFYATITSANVYVADSQGICTINDDDPKIDLSAALINLNTVSGTLSEANEEAIGAYVPLNDDDDDYDAQHVADKDQPAGAIVGENDLLPITLHKIDPSTFGGTYTLTIPSHVRIWENPDRTGAVSASTTFNATADKILYVEGWQTVSARSVRC